MAHVASAIPAVGTPHTKRGRYCTNCVYVATQPSQVQNEGYAMRGSDSEREMWGRKCRAGEETWSIQVSASECLVFLSMLTSGYQSGHSESRRPSARAGDEGGRAPAALKRAGGGDAGCAKGTGRRTRLRLHKIGWDLGRRY
jgi:hypothetical protein